MGKNENQFMTLLKRSVDCNLEKDTYFNDTDWKEIFKLGHGSALDSIICDVAIAQESMDAELKSEWKKYRLAIYFKEKRKLYSLNNLLKRAKEEGLTFTVFKGCILADLYPNYALRSSSDTDILISREIEDKALAVFEECGYEYNEKKSKGNVYVLHNAEYDHVVELHFSLYEDYEGTKIDIIKAMKLDDTGTFVTVSACGIEEVTTLGHQQHLIYQMFHLIKHFIVEGVTVRYMCDITLFVNKYAEQIDFYDFWDKMEKLGYTKFCETFFSLCCECMGMTEQIFEKHKCSVEKEKKEDMLKDLIYAGNVCGNKRAGWQILGIMIPFLVGKQSVSDSKLVRNLQVLFPPQDNLPNEYAYARKHKILLPVAWCHKGIYFITKRRKHKKDWYTPSQKLKAAEYRLKLIKTVGLVEEK